MEPCSLAVLQNLERGRGLLCRTLMKSQLASTEFSATFAALVAIINTKLPEVGELLLKRVVWQVGLEAAASHQSWRAASARTLEGSCFVCCQGTAGWNAMSRWLMSQLGLEADAMSRLACAEHTGSVASKAGGITFPPRPMHCLDILASATRWLPAGLSCLLTSLKQDTGCYQTSSATPV